MNNWAKDLEPLLKKYEKRKIPLNYTNRYQLLVTVILAAQTSDNHVNKMSAAFFKTFPSISRLKESTPEDLYLLVRSIAGFRKKAIWLVESAKIIRTDRKIPTTLKGLTKLPGIGRKTANVIIRESGGKAEGVIVDLHVVRVSPRLGVSTENIPEKIEKQLMDVVPQEKWNEIGMALSFHGRETCRPKPKCDQCIVNRVCHFYHKL